MTKLEQFDATLAAFDTEVLNLKAVGAVHAEVKNTAEAAGILVTELDKSNARLAQILGEYFRRYPLPRLILWNHLSEDQPLQRLMARSAQLKDK